MQDYLEKAREQMRQMELENRRFHAEMQRVDSINRQISAVLQIYSCAPFFLALSGLSINQPSSN